ncbi:MAG: hypothetical protein ACYDH9_18510, partial [Limisphaerales bacterium]
KKKTMKTKSNKNQSSELKSRPEQLSGNTNTETQPQPAAAQQQTSQQTGGRPARVLPYVNYQERDANRALPTHRVLDLLRRRMPAQYDLAEVVGKWVWITFTEQPAEQVRGQLSQFGFHWNNSRKCWQHPCGQFQTEGSDQNPREKYGSHFPADQDPNPYRYDGPPRTAEQVAA